MKVVVIGATGIIGRAIVSELSPRHEIIEVGKSRSVLSVDVLDAASVQRLFAKIGTFDAVVTAVGNVHFGPLATMTPDEFRIGLNDKLMGQINVVLAARDLIADGGSFTLTSGILSDEPIRAGASASTVNAAIDGFVRGAAIELPRGMRINSVSPTVLAESWETYGPYFRGFEPVPAKRVALAYSRSVEGAGTGQVYRVW
ncbi:MAG TPA: short chain dehydrogenase [Hyphomicrobium sp.]|jgi:NAD(P)-dependent dehydrogenase (short-subunit alcohol dehydrogenase family)|uniref:short chain dehydrogenase n=1 Tax=Hyphomicrobium sp. TaxID=82 RepID=UPI002D03E8E7|nr:short chain dehydrogenase [Hyphomicrobium sp.]HXE01597.1 short chain dehydrogenase [Hyphomicrobium sp.]